jgi:hypothetical protein
MDLLTEAPFSYDGSPNFCYSFLTPTFELLSASASNAIFSLLCEGLGSYSSIDYLEHF